MQVTIAQGTYVALDLETTGLIPENEEIIEIGAVKFCDGKEIDIFQSFVNPHRRIPYRVRSLCNITQGDVDSAPSFHALAEGLISFLEGYPLVGHNIAFDLSFLARKGIYLSSPAYDTYELTRILLPDLAERNLSAVAAHLGVPHPSAHRALADAIVGKGVFTILLRKLYELESVVLAELVRLTEKTDWWLGRFLREVAEERGTNQMLGEAILAQVCFRSLVGGYGKPLIPRTERMRLDTEALVRHFDDKGALALAFPDYEQRPQQIDMVEAVAEALNERQQLIVEAGTGTGKSMAYLLPAAFFACQNSVPVIISTNTINLQEQLVHKDIPDLLGAIDEIADISVAQLKGRTNYLCLRRWEVLRTTEGLPLEAIQLLTRIQVWLPSTTTGDRAEINIDGWEGRFWARVCAQDYDCQGKQCSYYQRGLCFLHRARKTAENAHLIVVNHALLLSEIAGGARILPESGHFIIDEAHHLEGVATDQLSAELREQDICDFLDRIVNDGGGQRLGFVSQLDYLIRTSDLDELAKNDLVQTSHSLGLGVAKVRARLSEFFNDLGDLLQDHGEGQGEYDLHLRITRAIRAQTAWSDIEVHCDNLVMALEDVAKMIQRISDIGKLPLPETLEFEMFSLLKTNEELRRQMSLLIFDTEENSIHWITLGRKSNMISLRSAPLNVGVILRDSFYYSQKDSLILTGATLSIDGNFEYLKGRLGIDNAKEMSLGSPFDYQRAALVYLVSDIPEPGRAGYQESVARALISLCRATDGRCLVLFTSHAALRAVQVAIQGPLEQDDILVLGQGVDGAPRKLIASLERNRRTVLLGAASFWEGVDVVGEALSALVVVRLPFNVPTDPVFAARSDTFDNPFNEYALPQAALKLKQGFGRLIRSKTDRGAMIVLDSRLSTKNYGTTFLNSLPPCQVERGPSRNMPGAVKGWLAGDGDLRRAQEGIRE